MPRPEARGEVAALAPVAQGLRELPHPVRTRIMLELAADVEDLTRQLQEAGAPREEAARRAVERLVPSGQALGALVRLHRPLYRRWMAPLPDSSVRRWERRAIVLVTTFALAAGVYLLWSRRLLDSPSPFLWGVLALATAIGAVSLGKAFQLFVRRDHREEVLDRGSWMLPALSLLTVTVAAAGTVADLWGLAATLEAAGPAPGAGALITSWLLRESVLVSTGLLTAMAGGLSWFLFAQQAAAIRRGDHEVRELIRDTAAIGGIGRHSHDTPLEEV